MFKIFNFKQLAVISFGLCLIMLTGALLNTFSPYVAADSKLSVSVPIVMYHQICEKESRCGDYAITVSLLREDFQYLKEHNFHPVSFKSLEEYVKTGKPLPENPIVITFDDGERSFITKVVPLLEEFSFPANVNIVGALVDLYTENGETDDRYAYLNAEDIKELSSNPLVEIGCHTYNLHTLGKRRGMSKLPDESETEYATAMQNDITLFQEKFYKITGKKTTCFAYPYGIRNDTVEDVLKNLKFTVTLTCRESPNTVTVGGDLYELGRFNRPFGKSSHNFFKKLTS